MELNLKSFAAFVMRRTRGLVPLLMLGALVADGKASHANTLSLTSLADSGAGSLRDRVAAAAAPGDTITFGVTDTIELDEPSIAIAKDLTITGPGASNLRISGNGNANRNIYRASLFNISGGGVCISGLTLSDGTGTEFSDYNNQTGTTTYREFGGAVYVSGGAVTMTGCTLQCLLRWRNRPDWRLDERSRLHDFQFHRQH